MEGSANLTLEEFLTVIIQFEDILNSRSLSPLSTDTDGFKVVTTGHFLIGKPINFLSQPNLVNHKDNILNKWQRVKKFVRLIWKR